MCVCVRVCVGLCVCERACVLKMCTAGMCGRDECLCVHVCLLFNSLNQEFMLTPSTGFGAQCHATARSSCQVNSARAKAHVGANHSEPVCVCVCVCARARARACRHARAKAHVGANPVSLRASEHMIAPLPLTSLIVFTFVFVLWGHMRTHMHIHAYTYLLRSPPSRAAEATPGPLFLADPLRP